MSEESASRAAARRVRFFYIKSNAFRVAHVDGVIGGVTPKGLIHVSVFSERAAIPLSADHEITPEGRLLEPISQEGKQGVVREIDIDLMMTRTTAAELRDWLTTRLNDLDRLLAEAHPADAADITMTKEKA